MTDKCVHHWVAEDKPVYQPVSSSVNWNVSIQEVVRFKCKKCDEVKTNKLVQGSHWI